MNSKFSKVRAFGQQGYNPDPFQGYRDLSPDLWPRRVRYRPTGAEGEGLPSVPDYTGTSLFVGKGLLGRVVLVTTTPVLIIRSEYAWPYIILNPYLPYSSGGTTYDTQQVYSGTETANGNSQATPVSVNEYRNVHFFLDVTACTGSWDFYAQVQDPASNNWADSQRIFTAVSSTGTYYANVGTFGIATQLAARWEEMSAGSITFTLTAVLKDVISPGILSTTDRTIFIGPNDAISTESAYPILPGNEKMLVVGENVEIWGVAYTDVLIRVFEV